MSTLGEVAGPATEVAEPSAAVGRIVAETEVAPVDLVLAEAAAAAALAGSLVVAERQQQHWLAFGGGSVGRYLPKEAAAVAKDLMEQPWELVAPSVETVGTIAACEQKD